MNSSPVSQAAQGPLLAEFGTVTYEDWRKLVDAELKGAPFDKKMPSSTYEGITLQPLYRRQDAEKLPHLNSLPGFAPFPRGGNAAGYVQKPWDISQEISVSSPSEFNNAARNFISRGLNALNMNLDQATRNGHDPDWAQPAQVGQGGVSIATLEDLGRALEGVDLAKTSLLVRAGASAMPFAALLVALVRKRKKSLDDLRGCIEMDPLAVLAHEGRLPQSIEGAYREMAVLTRWAAQHAPHLQTICVHSRAWHESGGSAVQELAFSLAMAVEYLRAMSNRGLEVDLVAPRLRFAITVGSNFFMEIAKLRALRMLWCRAVAAAGGNEGSQRCIIHVRTSHWNKTTYDPHNNMLRATVEAFAGVLGNCDSMQVGAFDEVFRRPDDFSQRIARNTQLVLQKECNLDHVIDPSGGSWYVESITSELADRAWALFQEVEKQGGMEASLRAGVPQKAISATAAEKVKNISRRRDSVIGVNQYANPKEKPLDRPTTDVQQFYRRRVQQVESYRTGMEEPDSEVVMQKLARVVSSKEPDLFEACAEAAASGATLGEVTRALRISDSPAAPITPVVITRAAAQVEQLRSAMDAFAGSGPKPSVFLANMGPVKEHKARADFSRGFLSVGGYDVLSPEGFKSVESAVEAFANSGASVAVICSTDENYPALVPPLVQGIRAKKKDAVVILAGYPQDQIEAHKKSGVDDFIHIRADAFALLTQLHSRLGIQS